MMKIHMDEDMVVLSQNEYDELLKAKHNLEYLQMLAISDQQIREGKVVNKTWDELEAMLVE